VVAGGAPAKADVVAFEIIENAHAQFMKSGSYSSAWLAACSARKRVFCFAR
jgi:hypothetical protein